MLKKIKMKNVYHTDFFFYFFISYKMHDIIPGVIQKSIVLKCTCLMSLYFKSEEDTMKNEIFLRLYIAHPSPRFEVKYLPNVRVQQTILVLIHTTACF